VKIFKLNTDTTFNENNICLAIGNFDGFHKGHQKIISILKKVSKEKNLQSAIMSFDPHPRKFFDNSIKSFNIYTKEDKLKFLHDFNINIYIDFLFDHKLSEYSSFEFIKNILVDKLKIKNLVVGSDFKFGKDRAGNYKILENYSSKKNFSTYVVDAMMLTDGSEKYSSSIIRENIKNGEFEKANFALGRPWHITGKIVEGDKRARQINFPTANMIPGDHILPRKGVYCIEAYFKNKKHLGISNFGKRPTVDGSKLLLETHIFDFNEEIYGNDLTVHFLTFIRPEQKFVNFDELTNQIKKDIEIAKKYHKI